MKQSLTLRLGQQQVITPQLSQAIRMLQLSTQELDLEVQEALESNPMLERDEAAPEAPEEEAAEEGEEAVSEAPEL
ncbi:MAG: RNA polymerase factor sigma-54, partial [Gammaproteobacteria bacterium]|nr:RNA polymerase factor sigma-54 [Gammaproteobacteria bacterium]